MNSSTFPSPSGTPTPNNTNGLYYTKVRVLALVNSLQALFMWMLSIVACGVAFTGALMAVGFAIYYVCTAVGHLWEVGGRKFKEYKERRRERREAASFGATEGSGLLGSGFSSTTDVGIGVYKNHTDDLFV